MSALKAPVKKPAPQPPSQQQQIAQLQLAQARAKNKDQAESAVQVLEHTVMARAEKWLKTARNIGSAYARAAKYHRDAVNEDSNHEPVQDKLLVLVLGQLLPTPVKWALEATVLKELGDALDQGLKDKIFKAVGDSAKTAVTKVVPSKPPPQARDAVDLEPPEFQNQLENLVSDFKIRASEFFAQLWKYFRDTPNDDASWDQVQVDKLQKMTDDWMNEAKPHGILVLSQSEERDVSGMAYEIERGFWAKWIFGLRSGWVDRDGWTHSDYEAVHSNGRIEGRLDALGILKEAGVTISRWHEAIEEDRPLIAWARDKYKPHPFKAE